MQCLVNVCRDNWFCEFSRIILFLLSCKRFFSQLVVIQKNGYKYYVSSTTYTNRELKKNKLYTYTYIRLNKMLIIVFSSTQKNHLYNIPSVTTRHEIPLYN